MSTAKKRSPFIHTLKGPERLAPDVIKEIVESRPLQNARAIMAKKHGISELRVGKIWTEFYGGGKLSDYKSGLKKELPTEPIEGNIRKVRTSRATYSVKEPKFSKADIKNDQQNRAKPTRVQKSEELEVFNDDIDDITDEQAEIIAGQVGAGNNNPELLELFERLIESRDRDTHYLYKLAKRRNKNKYESETDYESTNIDEDETDDSTISYRRVGNQRSDKESQRFNDTYADGDDTDAGLVLRHNNSQSVERLYKRDQREPVWPTPNRAGTSTIPQRAREPQYRETQQSDTYETARNEYSIPIAQYNTGQRCIQQDNAYNNTQCTTQSRESTGIPRTGGDNKCQTVEGIPWLRIKPF